MMKSTYLIPFIMAALLPTTMFLTIACDGSDNDVLLSEQQQPDHTQHGNGLHIVTTKQPFADENGTRTNTDLGGTYATTFIDGDQIGIIAAEGGAVLTDCNNVILTYNSTDNKWEGNDILYKAGATYMAYYPYQTVMNGKSSVQEIFDAFTVPRSQSTAELFAASDLMIADNGYVDKAAKTLRFAFEHKLAMLEIGRIHGRTDDGWLYPIQGAIFTGGSTINSRTFSFFINPAEGNGAPGRRFEKPGNTKLEIQYLLEGTNTTFYWNAFNQNLVAGQRWRIIPSKNRNIEVGDCYYSDGSIFPGKEINSIVSPPGGCIGVVFALGSTGIAAGDKAEYYYGKLPEGIHGYVTALNSTPPTIWQHSYEVMYWPSTDKTAYRGVRNATGREVAKFMKDFGTSPTSSGWYVPSLGQLRDMHKTRGTCEPNMKRAGGDGYLHSAAVAYKDGVWIWTNTCRFEYDLASFNNMWNIWFMGTDPTDGEERDFGTSANGNKYHSSVAHYCLTF